MLNIQTPDQVTAQVNAEQAKRLEANDPPPEIIDNLAAMVRHDWESAKTQRMTENLDQRLLDCLRRRQGKYGADKLAAIRDMGGSEIFMKLTGVKVYAAKAWLADIYQPSGDRPWSLEPTPIPELPPNIENELIQKAVQGALSLGVPLEVMQGLVEKHRKRLKDELVMESRERAESMATYIEDVVTESGFHTEFDKFLDDYVTYPYAIFKGPIYRKSKELKWVDVGTGQFVPQITDKIVRQLRRVSPFDIYPSPASESINDHWLIEHHRLTPEDLTNMRGAAGYNSANIAKAILQYRKGGLREWVWNDTERDHLEGRDTFVAKTQTIDALEWSGKVSGTMLLEWGMNPANIPDPYDEYQVSVMLVGNYVIRAILNPDPRKQSDYYKACWRDVPGSFAGEALPEILSDCQDLCNAAIRALANNMGIASGPMMYYFGDRLVDGQDVTHLHPWKTIGVTESRHTSSTVPVGWFQPDSNAQELLAIYERFSSYADNISGIPAYAYGSDEGAGAAKTASGLSMLMNASAKTIKQAIRAIDMSVIEPLIEKLYIHAMLDPTVDAWCKGDLKVKARGSQSILHKEANNQLIQQFLANTANPVDLQIVGFDARRKLLKETAKQLDMPISEIFPDDEMAQLLAQAQMMQQPQPQPQPAAEKEGNANETGSGQTKSE
ncbi:portal protein [Vibrio harveyi]|uniref:portal protein n=1 Tax=Vibrio harveyi TaxID=669 RepID=UPI003D70DBDA